MDDDAPKVTKMNGSTPSSPTASTAELQSAISAFDKCYCEHDNDFVKARDQVSFFLSKPRLIQSVTYRNAITLLKCITHTFGLFAPRIPVVTKTELAMFWKLVIHVFRVKTKDPQTLPILDEILEILRATDAWTIATSYVHELAETLISYSHAGAEFVAKLPNSIDFIRKHLSNRAFTSSMDKQTQAMVVIEMMKQVDKNVINTIRALDNAFGLNLLDVLCELKDEIISEDEPTRIQAIDFACSVIETANIREEHRDLVQFILNRNVDISETIRLRIVDLAFCLFEKDGTVEFTSECADVIVSRMNDPSRHVRLKCWQKKLPIEYDYHRYINDLSNEVCERVAEFCCDDLASRKYTDITPLVLFHMHTKSPKLLQKVRHLVSEIGYISLYRMSDGDESFFDLLADAIDPESVTIDTDEIMDSGDKNLISKTAKIFPGAFIGMCDKWLDQEYVQESSLLILASLYEYISDKEKFLMAMLRWNTRESILIFAMAANNNPLVEMVRSAYIVRVTVGHTTTEIDLSEMDAVLECEFLLRIGQPELVPMEIFDVNFSRIAVTHADKLMKLASICSSKQSLNVCIEILTKRTDKLVVKALTNLVKTGRVSLDQVYEISRITAEKARIIKDIHKAVCSEGTLTALMIDLFLTKTTGNAKKTQQNRSPLKMSEPALAKFDEFAKKADISAEFVTQFLIRKFGIKSVMETCQMFMNSERVRRFCRQAISYCLSVSK